MRHSGYIGQKISKEGKKGNTIEKIHGCSGGGHAESFHHRIRS